MRWGPLLFLLLVSATFALSPVHAGKIVGTGLELREFGQPIALDIDSDGKDEAFIWSSDGRTYLLDGKDLASWKNFTGQIVGMAPIDDKVVLAETDKLHILGSYKEDLLGWPHEGSFTGPPVVADLDMDGVAEILVPTAQGLEIRYTYGPARVLPVLAQKISVGDVTGNGKLEIVVTEKDKVHLFDSDYQEIDGWPKSIPGTLSRPTISQSEIAVSTSQGELWVWKADGSEVLRKSTGQHTIYTDIPAPLFVDDLVVLPGPENEIRAFRGEDEIWATSLENVTNIRFDSIAVDVEGDSKPELLVPGDFYLYVLDLEGGIVEVFQMDGNIKAPIVLDLFDDERSEVLVVSEETFALMGDSLMVLQNHATLAEPHQPVPQQPVPEPPEGDISEEVPHANASEQDVFELEQFQLSGTLRLARVLDLEYAFMKDKLYKTRAKLMAGLLREEHGADHLDYEAALLLAEVQQLHDEGRLDAENAARLNNEINELDAKLDRLIGINAGFGVPLGEEENFMTRGLTSIAREGFKVGNQIAQYGNEMRGPAREKCDQSISRGRCSEISLRCKIVGGARSVMVGFCSVGHAPHAAAIEFAGGFIEGLSVLPALGGMIGRIPQVVVRDLLNGKILENPWQYTTGGTVAVAERITDGLVGFANGAIDHPVEAAGQIVGVSVGKRVVEKGVRRGIKTLDKTAPVMMARLRTRWQHRTPDGSIKRFTHRTRKHTEVDIRIGDTTTRLQQVMKQFGFTDKSQVYQLIRETLDHGAQVPFSENVVNYVNTVTTSSGKMIQFTVGAHKYTGEITTYFGAT